MSPNATAELARVIAIHTTLQLAGLNGAERRCRVATRLSAVSGMPELARRLPACAAMVAVLEEHRHRLREQAQREA